MDLGLINIGSCITLSDSATLTGENSEMLSRISISNEELTYVTSELDVLVDLHNVILTDGVTKELLDLTNSTIAGVNLAMDDVNGTIGELDYAMEGFVKTAVFKIKATIRKIIEWVAKFFDNTEKQLAKLTYDIAMIAKLNFDIKLMKPKRLKAFDYYSLTNMMPSTPSHFSLISNTMKIGDVDHSAYIQASKDIANKYSKELAGMYGFTNMGDAELDNMKALRAILVTIDRYINSVKTLKERIKDIGGKIDKYGSEAERNALIKVTPIMIKYVTIDSQVVSRLLAQGRSMVNIFNSNITESNSFNNQV